jgi:Uma2 family endonuclease
MMVRTAGILKRRRFDVDDLDRMIEAGVFRPDERFELIDGEVVEMPLPGPLHSGKVDRLNRLLVQRCGERCIVRVQNPLQLDRHNRFLPDLALIRADPDFYCSRYPTAADTLLAIEVADASLSRDRRVKLPRYAELGVPEVWILDLRHRCVHVSADLQGGGYRTQRRCAGGDQLYVPADDRITAAELLG